LLRSTEASASSRAAWPWTAKTSAGKPALASVR